MRFVRTVTAFNTAAESANKIHDDETAGRFGFAGGLVPGVDVFAYMVHAPVAAWGEDFLRRGRMRARFEKPVYDGDEATTEAETGGEGALSIRLTARGRLCATGTAVAEDDAPAPPLAPLSAGYAWPDAPPASAETLAPGTVLGSIAETYFADEARRYRRDVREDHPLFKDGRIAHPGYLLRRANYALAYNVRLGPWIHVESDLRLHDILHDGEPFETRAAVVENVERKGHLIATLDVTISARHRLIASIKHWAIWAPRQTREAQAPSAR